MNEEKMDWYLNDPYYHVVKSEQTDKQVTLYVEAEDHPGVCPDCGHKTEYIQAKTIRTLQNSPLNGKKTILKVKVNQYVCLNEKCKKRLFTEPLSFANKYSRRTHSLDSHILAVASQNSNLGASKTLNGEGIEVSNKAIERLYDKIELEEEQEPEIVGVDDVAGRKGRYYYTVIYDWYSHEMLALMDGRRATPVKEWFKNHPGVKIAARDRSGSYASGIKAANKECMQVADRFHLLQNLSDQVLTLIKEEIPKTVYYDGSSVLVNQLSSEEKKELEKLYYDNSVPRDENGNEITFFNKFTHAKRAPLKSGLKKQKLILDVKKRHEDYPYFNNIELARWFEVTPDTIKRYLEMPVEEVEAMSLTGPGKKRSSPYDEYVNIIYKMLRDGFNRNDICYYITNCTDFNLNRVTLRDYVRRIDENNFGQSAQKEKSDKITAVEPFDILKFITAKSEPEPDGAIKAVFESYPNLYSLKEGYRDFYNCLMKQTGDLDSLIEKYKDSKLESFYQGLKKDIDAVKNAISSPYSSGFVEGLNNKFKLIKRIVYGRAGVVNLEKKCKLAFRKFDKDFRFIDLVRKTPEYAYFQPRKVS